jgi:hypothetical protein
MSNNYPCYKLSRRIVDNHIPLDNLRLETSPTRFCVVPYHHLEFAEFESAQSDEVITLHFLNRSVRIRGRNLRTLGEALQERTVESINLLPERYQPLVSGEVRVTTIEIEPKENHHA